MSAGITKNKILASFIYCAVFLASFIIYTQNNDFCYLYHTTEETKIAQITTHQYNLNHPLLMLDAAEVVSNLTRAETYQEKVAAGRLVSALFASITVFILMLVANQIAGFYAAAASGVLLLFSPMMIRLSHYFKEDPTLAFGISLSFITAAFFFKRPSFRNFIFMIIATAIAASGKYVGFVLLPMGIAIAIIQPYQTGKGITPSVLKRVFIYLSAFISSYLILNFQMLLRIGYIIQKLSPKISATAAKQQGGVVAFTGHGGAMVTHPWRTYLDCFFYQTSVIIPLLVIIYLVYFLFTFRRRMPIEKFIVAFLFFFTFILSLGKVASGQYFLPQELISHLLAGITIVVILSPVKQRYGNRIFIPAFAVSLITISILLFPFAEKSLHQFQPSVDTRKALISWLELNLKEENVKIASDKYVLLPDVIRLSPVLSSGKNISVSQMEYTGDLETLSNAKFLGYTHIAVSSDTYGRFFNSSCSASVGGASVYDRRRKFYTELFEKGGLIWEADSKYGGIVNTPIRLYKLPSHNLSYKEVIDGKF